MSEEKPSRREFWVVVALIAGTYGYFLIFAQFAFLELLRAKLGAGELRPAMGAMGLAGVAGSGLAAWRFRPETYRLALRGGAVACVLAAGAGCLAASPLTAAGIGLALGWLTVTMVSGLRAAIGMQYLGRAVGVGTGLAYAACNLPGVFTAAPLVQAGIASVLMTVAALATRWVRTGEAEVSHNDDFRPVRVVGWVGIFLALVWMDSAAFYVIQHTPVLRAETWGGNVRLLLNATIHLAVAVGAGVWMDRGRFGRVVLAGWAALAGACLLLDERMRPFVGIEVLYTAGVSAYSVALVYYPARGGRAWLAGALLAIAGWLGSALGIGMAQDLNRLPVGFVLGACAVVTGLLLIRHRGRRLRRPLLLTAAGLLWLPTQREARAADVASVPAEAATAVQASPSAQVARGREVFISEGCIHCHSQYVRPGTLDVEWWGPAQPLAAVQAQNPPLPGNRRQGPDLAQVGNRRSSEWNRLHLIAPRTISAGSRMPVYAQLFREGDERGEDLLVYLDSLGADTLAERAELIKSWSPSASAGTVGAALGRRLFGQLCAQCHGDEGRGDGSLVARLSVRPPDWTLDDWRRVDAADEARSLARIIKFGLFGSPMAGHETLADDEVVALAAQVLRLRGERETP